MDDEFDLAIDLSDAELKSIERRAVTLDETGAFPDIDVGLLHHNGVLLSVAPRRLAGNGHGVAGSGHRHLKSTLSRLGSANLSLGRLFEGHVNAARLVYRYATEELQVQVTRDIARGHLLAIWNTESIGQPVRLIADGNGWRLSGRKVFASGVGHIKRAVISALDENEIDRLVYVDLAKSEVELRVERWAMNAMRATINGAIDLSGLKIEPTRIFGAPGDYFREPDFSAGAWRTQAVHLGGMNAIAGALADHLLHVAQDKSDIQRVRLATTIAHCQTASLWVDHCACVAEKCDLPTDEMIATVNIARHVVSEAAASVIAITKQAVGARAFQRGHPAERLLRDLDFYLRQPAPDQAMLSAASHFLARRQIATAGTAEFAQTVQ